MSTVPSLSADQLDQSRAICEEVCEQLETHEEYNYDLDERRGKAASFGDEVWDHAIAMLRQLGLTVQRTGAVIAVSKPVGTADASLTGKRD